MYRRRTRRKLSSSVLFENENDPRRKKIQDERKKGLQFGLKASDLKKEKDSGHNILRVVSGNGKFISMEKNESIHRSNSYKDSGIP